MLGRGFESTWQECQAPLDPSNEFAATFGRELSLDLALADLYSATRQCVPRRCTASSRVQNLGEFLQQLRHRSDD